MKTSRYLFALIALFVLTATSGFSQLFTPKIVTSTVVGAGAGALIGNKSGQAGRGALVGGVAGYGLSLAAQQFSNQHSYAVDSRTGIPSPARKPVAYPNAGKYTGVFVGGAAGAIYGRNHGATGKDAAIGAAVGLLIGSVTDHFRNKPASRGVVTQAPDDLRDWRSLEHLARLYGNPDLNSDSGRW